MKKGLLVIGLLLLLTGCNGEKQSVKNDIKEQSVENDIKEYESEIEKALLMDNDYQDAKYTSCLEKLEKYLEEVRGQHSFKVASKYEGLTLDEALEKYNKENGTKLTNITKELAPEREKELALIENEEENTVRLQRLIDSYEKMIEEEEESSIGKSVFLSAIAEKMVECEGECTSNHISLEDATKKVEASKGKVEEPENKELISSVLGFATYGNFIEVKGQLVNPTENSYRYVEIKVDLKDSNGDIIDTNTTYAVGGEIFYPNDTKKWDVIFDADSRVDHVTAHIVDYEIR